MKIFTPAILALCLLVACGSETPADGTSDTTVEADATVEADTAEPSCGYTGTYLIPGPCEDGHDAELALKARRYERTWVTFHAAAHGGSVDLGVSDPDDRALIQSFVDDDDGWDFEAFSGGKAALEIVGTGGKVAGLYAGVGIAASAYRYGVLRDQGYPQAEVDLAREHLMMGLEVFEAHQRVYMRLRGVEPPRDFTPTRT